MAKGSAITTALCGIVLLAGCGSSSSNSTTQAAQQTSTQQTATQASSGPVMGFEGVPIEQGTDLAPASTTGTTPVDGIQCAPVEQLVYHIHAHLAVYDKGALRPLPGGVGIPGSQVQQSQEGPVAAGGRCYYWLHTHAPDGVIHIESPVRRVYTLGNFFDEWHQPLSSTRVGGVTGKVTAFVNGKTWKKDLRTIPLVPHAVIQLNVGSPVVPFQRLSWGRTQL